MLFFYLLFSVFCATCGSGAIIAAWLTYKKSNHPALRPYFWYLVFLTGTVLMDLSWSISRIWALVFPFWLQLLLGALNYCLMWLSLAAAAAAVFRLMKPMEKIPGLPLIFMFCAPLIVYGVIFTFRRLLMTGTGGGVMPEAGEFWDVMYLMGQGVMLVLLISLGVFYIKTVNRTYRKIIPAFLILNGGLLVGLVYQTILNMRQEGYKQYYAAYAYYCFLSLGTTIACAGYLLRGRSMKSVAVPDDFGAGYGLTARERDLLPLILRGLDNKRIAFELKIKLQTVKQHLSRVYQKTGTVSRWELMNLIVGKTPPLP